MKDESSKKKISGMAKSNHSTVGFKGLTHAISYNVRTTTCSVLASAAQANTTPMQKPNSVAGQACLSSALLTAHNIASGGFNQSMHCSHCAYCIRTGTHLFLPLNRHHFVPSYCCTAVLISARKIIRMNAESSRSELTISSCLGLLLIIVHG